jgi:hypothetical protein
VPLGDTAKKPGVFERHEVREMLAERLVHAPGGQLKDTAAQR